MKTPFLTVPTMIFRLSQRSAKDSVAEAAAKKIVYRRAIDLRYDENDEVVLRAQMSAANPAHPGELALRAAILERAIWDLELGNDKATRDADVRTDAMRWIKTGDDNNPFSFTAVCQALGIDPDAAQTAIIGPPDAESSEQ